MLAVVTSSTSSTSMPFSSASVWATVATCLGSVQFSRLDLNGCGAASVSRTMLIQWHLGRSLLKVCETQQGPCQRDVEAEVHDLLSRS